MAIYTYNQQFYQELKTIANINSQKIVEHIKKQQKLTIDENNNSNNPDSKISTQFNVVLQSAFTSYFPLWCINLHANLNSTYIIGASQDKQKTQKSRVPLIIVTPNDEFATQFMQTIKVFNNLNLPKEKLSHVPSKVFQHPDNSSQPHENSSQLPDNNSQVVINCIHLPSWGAVLGSGVSLYAPIRAQRALALYQIAHMPPDILVCSIEQWNSLLPPKQVLLEQSFKLHTHLSIDPTEIITKLSSWQYLRVPKVSNVGEFSVRGDVIDIFISNTQSDNNNVALRITFDYDHIESIKTLDVTSQLSSIEINSVLIHPRTEFFWNKNLIENLSDTIHNKFPEISSSALAEVKKNLEVRGYDEWDYLYGMFAYTHPTHILEYMYNKNQNPPLVLFSNFEMLSKLEDFYRNKQKELFLNLGSIKCIPKSSRIVEMINKITKNAHIIPVYRNLSVKNTIAIGDTEANAFAGNISYFTKHVETKHKEGVQVYVSSDNETHIERILLLIKGATSPHIIEQTSTNTSTKETNQESHLYDIPLKFINTMLQKGFSLLADNIECYTEIELLGKKLHQFNSKYTTPISIIQQIEPGDLVVHLQYGIGKFEQLSRMTISGVEKEFIQLRYANDEKLYVPIEQLNMVQRYIGKSTEAVSLDIIGSKAWEKRKQKVLASVEDMSKDLLEVHAKRNAMRGYAFEDGKEWEQEFISNFEFDETDDQLTSWEEISKDMADTKPMDRLLVGDVGFGKTEIAFRAAFRAICSGKQVVFLVPTTILAEQHYNSSQERFKNFPVNIAMISRFLFSAEQKKVIAKIESGKIDLVIGTHRIIQKDIIFKDLGLCIIDEEHRFGVKDKEHIKKLYPHIDYLSLSATPIPRTLYQSIVQLRDMSLLSTPPKKRKPIRTFIEKFDETIVAKAIKAEIERGGQVFYLHNRIRSLEEVQQFIEKLVPETTVLTASGQMQAKQLEDTMYRFVHKGANVLVSTTIIENGIDIPSVNTIIIDRADNYGIAQLYQLRGRVGRSDQVSYAYLLYPDESSISEIALKRLSTISDNSELGAGFQIAMRDLEVRGMGNLLGKEQSGSIYSVGYEYYMKLLDDAMRKSKGLAQVAPEPILELTYSGYIPDTYINDIGSKMEVYKNIVSVKTIEEYEQLEVTLQDNYGHLPQEVVNLLWISKIKIICTSLYIEKIKDIPHAIELHFSQMSKLPVENITKLIKQGSLRISRQKSNILIIPYKDDMQYNLKQKYLLLDQTLVKISKKELN